MQNKFFVRTLLATLSLLLLLLVYGVSFSSDNSKSTSVQTSTSIQTSATPPASPDNTTNKFIASAYVQVAVVFALVGLGIAVGSNWAMAKTHMADTTIHHSDKELVADFVGQAQYQADLCQIRTSITEAMGAMRDSVLDIKELIKTSTELAHSAAVINAAAAAAATVAATTANTAAAAASAAASAAAVAAAAASTTSAVAAASKQGPTASAVKTTEES